MSTDIPVQRNGRPYSGEPQDPGVAVWWRVGDGPWLCVAIDRFRGVAYNMRAAMLVIEGRRRELRYGTDALVAASWSVFEIKALPVPARPWHDVLGVSPDAPTEVVEAAYRALARIHHPGKGGDSGYMAEINAAIEEARRPF
ncbi:MAG: J domain-containing protein [Fimbriimonadaceae bacterium]|nr:J domain-containing protein [Fimbriimonadaceae bacterium]QYK58040.1 MAG: J domain-containing protein [Fimbriimonadaceae bacterium]